MTPSLLPRLVRRAKLILQGHPKCLGLVRDLIHEKSGLEIGGPSTVFRSFLYLPIYEQPASLDNCDFAQNTTWASHQGAYKFSKSKSPGKSYFCDGSDLCEVGQHQYDFLLSSHNLEHFANPIKALKEWQRVIRPGGSLVIVLPHYAKTFDHLRTPTPVQHMFDDYERQMGEDDLTHVDEIFRANRLDGGAGSDEDLRALLLDNFNHRMMHHHVFDETNSKELMERVGFKVLAVETQLPFHIYLVVQTPQNEN
jgi:predicted SAM-dependent methyltransferase